MQPLVFIPPSESKAPGGEASFLSGHGKWGRDLSTRRERVLAALEKAMKGKVADREEILRVKGDALADVTAKNLAVRGASLTMPAAERFSGVLFEHLAWGTLPESAKRSLQDHVVVVDGLYGLLALSDEIPDYKLPMEAELPDVGKLADFWRDPFELTLRPLVGRREFWDLLPDSHRRAVPKTMPFALTVDVVELADGEPRKSRDSDKAVKGALLRHLALRGFTRANLESFASDGFALDRERSRPDAYVFSKVVEAPAKPARKAAPKAKDPRPAPKGKPAKAPAKKTAKKAARKKA